MINLVTTLLETISFLILSAGFISEKLLPIKRMYTILPIMVVKIIYLSSTLFIQSEYIDSCINILMGILTIVLYFKIPLKNSIFCYISGYIIILSIQLPFALFNQLLFHINNADILLIIGAIYSFIVSMLIYHFFNLHKLYSILYESGHWGTICLTNLFAFSVIFALYFKLDKKHFFDIILFIIISFTILLYVNIILIYQLKRMHKQREQLKAYEQYIPMLNNLILDIRSRQHNHSNEIQAIFALMYTHENYDSLTKAMKKYLNISKNTIRTDSLLKINLSLVAGFLYHKECIAKQQKKTIAFHILNYTLKSNVAEYNLIELFGILIDNALEAVPKNSVIDITIDSLNNKIIFITQNPGFLLTNEDRKLFFTKGYSNKPELSNSQHTGLGLYHLKNLVINQYHGQLALWNEGTDILFRIEI